MGGNTLPGTDAISTLMQGDFQESEVGLNLQFDLGFRRALTTVRQQQLFLARERSVLQDQELELSHQLTEAVRVLDTNYTLVQTIFNRRLAAERQVKSVEAAYKNGTVTFDLLLDAQRRQADAESAYYRALPITTRLSPRSTTARVRCSNTTTSSWPKAHGRARPTSMPNAVLANVTPATTSTTATLAHRS